MTASKVSTFEIHSLELIRTSPAGHSPKPFLRAKKWAKSTLNLAARKTCPKNPDEFKFVSHAWFARAINHIRPMAPGETERSMWTLMLMTQV